MTAIEVVLIVLTAVLIWAVFRYWYLEKRCHFVCPFCGKKFKPSVPKLVFSMNALNGKVLKCPACGSETYMEPERDSTASDIKKDGSE